MAKKEWDNKDQEMNLEEAKAYRASLHKPVEQALNDQQKREQFRLFWATNRNKYGKEKKLEEVLWIHLKSAKFDDPKKFEEGLANFGLKKIR
jgi:hypothetical protein